MLLPLTARLYDPQVRPAASCAAGVSAQRLRRTGCGVSPEVWREGEGARGSPTHGDELYTDSTESDTAAAHEVHRRDVVYPE